MKQNQADRTRIYQLAARHAELEGQADVEPLLATLVADPLYQFPMQRLQMRGGAIVRRFYERFAERFGAMSDSSRLVAEWVNDGAVIQEYELTLRVDGEIEHHNVVGILPASGELLDGERIYGSERFIRLLLGEEIFAELEAMDS